MPTLNLLDTAVKGVIFDLDGTLVESSLNFTLIRKQLGCPKSSDLLTFIDNIKDSKSRLKAQMLVIEHELEDAHQSKWLPGAQALVSRLHQLNIPQAIVTRNSADASRIKICNNHIPIDRVISRESCHPKPSPEALFL